MNILYVGELNYGSTARMRMEYLQQLGHCVEGIDTCFHLEPDFITRNLARIFWRLGWPLDLTNLNKRLIGRVLLLRPEIVWVDKGLYIRRDTLAVLKRRLPSLRLIHYNPDDPFGHGGRAGWRRFIHTIPEYDVHFVPRKENIQEYEQRGCKRVIHNIPTRGFDPDIHKPYPADDAIKRDLACDLGFLGGYEKERAASLLRLGEAGHQVRLMVDWPESYWHKNFLRAPYQVRGKNYAKAISSFKIGLGFLRKSNRDQHTSRSIEIPACGTFMLAERTEEHLMLFEEGKEAEFFSSDEEMIDKVRFYLANDTIREAIARAGHKRCLRSGYDYTSRMRQMLEQVMQVEN
jgi:hypothetical protein